MNQIRKDLIEKGYIKPSITPLETVNCGQCGTPFERIPGAKWDRSCGSCAFRRRNREEKGN